MYEREIACALAHPYYTVAAPLSARHRRRLAELFAVWEIRNGARARELNRPAATYVVTRDGIGIGGSDDHAGVDIGRTFTEAPAASTPAEFLAHMRAGRVIARGAQGSAAKWAHAAIALAARSLGLDEPARQRPRPGSATRDGDDAAAAARGRRAPGRRHAELDARGRALPAARVAERGGARPPRRARPDRVHAGAKTSATPTSIDAPAACTSASCARPSRSRSAAAGGDANVLSAAGGLFEACIAAIPYAPATAFLANEQAKLAAIPYPSSAWQR